MHDRFARQQTDMERFAIARRQRRAHGCDIGSNCACLRRVETQANQFAGIASPSGVTGCFREHDAGEINRVGIDARHSPHRCQRTINEPQSTRCAAIDRISAERQCVTKIAGESRCLDIGKRQIERLRLASRQVVTDPVAIAGANHDVVIARPALYRAGWRLPSILAADRIMDILTVGAEVHRATGCGMQSADDAAVIEHTHLIRNR